MKLRQATIADANLLHRWDEEPHVQAASGDDPAEDWDVVLGEDSPFSEILIAEHDGRPIGALRIIDPAREETHYWGDVPDNLRAIDVWIGTAADRGRGFGTRMMTLAINRCFAAPRVSAILIDPLATNTAAHRFYERLGFRFVEQRRFGNDDCCVYRLERQSWQGTP